MLFLKILSEQDHVTIGDVNIQILKEIISSFFRLYEVHLEIHLRLVKVCSHWPNRKKSASHRDVIITEPASKHNFGGKKIWKNRMGQTCAINL